MSGNLASKAINGFKWNSVSTVLNAIMQMGYMSVMARLLGPEAYGLIAISLIVLQFGGYFAGMGLNKAIVQIEHLEKEQIRAAFTSSFLLGLIFTGLTWVLAPFIASLFKNQDVIPVVRIMSFSFLVNGLSATAVSLLERNMQFKAISILETVSYVISYLGIGFILAYLGFGVYSLVYATLAQATIVALGSYAVIRHNVLLIFRWDPYKPLLLYGSKMSFISILEWLSSSLPTILIGRLLGDYRLGIYDRAHKLVSLPMYNLTRIISKIAFPSFSKLQSDSKKLGKIYLSSITLLAALMLPVCAGIAAAAPEIVYTLLGDKFSDSIPILQVLSLAIAFNLITMFAGITCDAKAVLYPKIVLSVVYILVICGLMFLMRNYGLVGLATAILMGELIRVVLYQRLMNKVLDLSYRQQLSIYLPGMMNGILVALGIYLVSSLLRSADAPVVLIFAAQGITGAILLLVLTLLFPHKLLRTELQMVLNKMGFNGAGNTLYSRLLHKYKLYILKGA